MSAHAAALLERVSRNPALCCVKNGQQCPFFNSLSPAGFPVNRSVLCAKMREGHRGAVMVPLRTAIACNEHREG
jgi:hypothetical protein